MVCFFLLYGETYGAEFMKYMQEYVFLKKDPCHIIKEYTGIYQLYEFFFFGEAQIQNWYFIQIREIKLLIVFNFAQRHSLEQTNALDCFLVN